MDGSLLNPDNYKVFPFQVPKTQALNSETFRLPPLDGSHSLSELYDWHLENSTSHPIFVYAQDDGKEQVIYWPEAVRAAHRAGRIVRSRLRNGSPTRPLVGLLCAADTITSFLTQIGIVRANCVVFPISVRNSPAAVAHLLAKTNVTHLLVGPETPHQQLATAAMKIMLDSGTYLPDTSTMLSFDEIMREEGAFEPLPPVKFEWDDPAVVMHSSGSTAFPKPIVWSHWRHLQLGIVPYFGEKDFTGLRLGIQSLPMYHGMGIMQVACAACCGVVLTAFRPQIPAVTPTPDNQLRSFMDTKTDIGFCVPIFVEMWARNPEHVRVLKSMKGIMYGGGPLAKKVGDHLTQEGVNIFILYGSSEVGIMSPIVPAKSDTDWQYFKFADNVRTHMRYEDNGTAELVILPSPHVIPSVLNTVVDDSGAYATSDLFEPHPTKSGYWRVYGRTDDQIMHNTGEKTNPGPLEAILNQDPHVNASVMFGRGKFMTGVLVDPKPDFKFDPTDTVKLAEYRNLVWPSVERMNEFAPQHSRLFKEMILVSSPSKPLTFTAKLTPRRQAILNEYDQEIEALYAAAAETTQAADNIIPPKYWGLEETMSFIRQIVQDVLKKPVDSDADIFQSGCDSLQATWIRNSILHALRESAKVSSRGIAPTFVYQFPTIAGLARFISDIVNMRVSGGDPAAAYGSTPSKATVDAMLEMVDKYTANLPKHNGNYPLPSQDVVLVTGTTGALGATLLGRLVQTDQVSHIYAVNRRNNDGRTLEDRQRDRLEEWGLDPQIIRSGKITFIETDMSADRLGLSEAMYEQIRTTVTHIIHNAYRVNFALSLASFDSNVGTARHLVDLALSSPYASPARILLTSTIGVVHHHSYSGAVSEDPVPPESALSNGYTQSKWVMERILQVTQEYTPLHAVSVRVGQVTGGVAGAWNKAEWFPAMLKSSQYLGCLPMIDKVISWVPVDCMATALVELRNAPYPVVHLAHPRPVAWSNVINPISNALALPLVHYDEWLSRLRSSASEGSSNAPPDEKLLQSNPALMLIDFFTHATTSEAQREDEAMGMRTLKVTKTVQATTALSETNLPPLGAKIAMAWLSYWQRVGFLA